MEIIVDVKPITSYYSNGNKRRESWYFNGQYHRVDGPADILYYESGQVQREVWYHNDELHRIDGPAGIQYYESGMVKRNLLVS